MAIVPTTAAEYFAQLKERLSWLERATDAATGLDERIDITNRLLIEAVRLLTEGLTIQIPEISPVFPPLPVSPIESRYNILKYLLDEAREAPGDEIDVPGDTITAYSDGSLVGIYVRLDSPTNDAIPLNEFNPYRYRAKFDKFWLETPAQAGRYLRLHVGRQAGAEAAATPPPLHSPNKPNVITGQKDVTAAGSPEQLDDLAIPDGFGVTIIAKTGNTGYIYLGATEADCASSSSRFDGLSAGLAVSLKIENLNKVWVDASVNGEGVSWIVEQD